MRAHVLNGTGGRPSVYTFVKSTGLVGRTIGAGEWPPTGWTPPSGSMGTGNETPLEQLAALGSAIGGSPAGANAQGFLPQVWQWVRAHAGDAWSFVSELFHFGPSYTAANGGEITRQFEGEGRIGDPVVNAYTAYVKSYFPAMWNSGDIWEDDQPGAWRPFEQRYVTMVQAGMPAGTLVDADMVPLGMVEAVQAVQANEEAAAQPWMTSPQVLAGLNLLAMRIAGLEGPQQRAQAIAEVLKLREPMQFYVADMVQVWLASNATGGEVPPPPLPDPPGPAADKGTNNLLLAAVGAKLLGLF